MTNKEHTRLSADIASRKCVLFAGSGLTASTGGATWNDLVSFLKKEFNYSSPLTDNFHIIGDLIRKHGGSEVYNVIRKRLKDASIGESILTMIGLPWFSVFTTNYDLALEKALLTTQNLAVRTILTGNEFALTGLPTEMLCIKLMGSLDKPYSQPGSMVLDAGDLAKGREERGRIFDLLSSHAANLSFLFVGYSFSDGLFIEILDRLAKALGTPTNTYYALFKEEPDEEKRYHLEQYGVKIIIDDIGNFSESLTEQVSVFDPTNYTIKKMVIGSNIIPIDTTKISSFLSIYNPILFEYLENAVTPNDFFKGYTGSFQPFNLNWHFERKEINQLVSSVKQTKIGDKPKIILAEGNPGSGRTFTILAAINYLIRNHNTIAVEIPSYSLNPIPNIDDFMDFINEIEQILDENQYEQIERIVFYATFSLEFNVISQFSKLCSRCKYPLSIIFEDNKFSQVLDFLSQEVVEHIEVGSDLDESEKENLAKYLVQMTLKHKFTHIDEEESLRIVKEEKQLFPILYRTLDPARRSINKIIEEEFQKITKTEISKLISFVAIPSSYEIDLPLTILRKAQSNYFGKFLSYPDVYNIIEEARIFVSESYDHRTNPLVSIYHSLIARRLLAIIGREETNQLLYNIAQTADLRSKIEADFIGNLLIAHGVNLESDSRIFSSDGLENALLELKKRQPARPIVHHLARFYAKNDILDGRIIPLLEEALIDPPENYALTEKKDNVITTLAKIKWDQYKDSLVFKPRNDPEIQYIIDLLQSTREAPNPNLHSFDIHARILKDMWKNKEDVEKMILVAEAVEVINQGLDLGIDDDESNFRLESLLIDALSEVDPDRARNTAHELLVKNKDGTGYYALAQREYYKNTNPVKANEFLDIALEAEKYPAGTVVLKIEIVLNSRTPSYFELLNLVENLNSILTHKDTWKSAYYKAAIYTINGYSKKAAELFKISNMIAPKNLQRRVRVFWMEGGRRKVHRGKIDRILTEREGRIYSHTIEGWNDSIFFNPRFQNRKNSLKSGMFVDFELGFSTLGPIAFDVRPHRRRINSS